MSASIAVVESYCRDCGSVIQSRAEICPDEPELPAGVERAVLCTKLARDAELDVERQTRCHRDACTGGLSAVAVDVVAEMKCLGP